MSQREVLRFPDPRLRTIATPVSEVNGEIQTLLDDMLKIMYEAPGIGLAGTQVNFHQRVVVIDVSEGRDQPLCLINPEVLACEGEVESEEGCLSVPGVFEKVHRGQHIHYRAIDRDGEPFEREAEGLLAVCIQHEIDHLQGKLFIDHLSAFKRQRIRKRLEKQEKEDRKKATAEANKAAVEADKAASEQRLAS